LRSLLENDSIDNKLSHLEDEEHFDDNDNDSEDMIGSNFVPTPLPLLNEERTIADTFE